MADSSFSGKSAAAGGISVISLLYSMGQERAAQKHALALERRRNQLRRMGDAMNQNNITVNEIWRDADLLNAAVRNQLQYQGASGTIAVQAAVMGFSGNTLDALQRDAVAAANQADLNLMLQHSRAQLQARTARLKSTWDAYSSLEDEWVQKPDYFGMSLATGEKIAMAMAGGAG